MQHTELVSALSSVIKLPEQVADLINRVIALEKNNSVAKAEIEWLEIAEAAPILSKTPEALRQRLKNKKKPLPKGRVWKQEARGHTIYVNIVNYRKFVK